MITRGDIFAALEAYWETDGGSASPFEHSAVRALLDKAEMADAACDRTLATASLPTSANLLDQIAAAIHGAVCDATDRTCIDADKLDAAAHAVLDMLVQAQGGNVERERERRLRSAAERAEHARTYQVQYVQPVPAGLREQMAGRTLRGGPFQSDPFRADIQRMTQIMETFSQAVREVGPVVVEAYREFSRKINQMQADLDRTKVRMAFADQAPAGLRTRTYDRDGAEWRKIDEIRWASLAYLGRYLVLADLEASLGPLSDNPPPVAGERPQ